MTQVISDKAQIQAVNDAQAAKLYTQLETVAAQVSIEKGAKRVKAVDLAARMIELGYSLRGAAKAAGKKPDNKLQRYFEIGRARLSEGETAIPVPEGFGTWADAVAGMSLEDLADHVRAVKTGRKTETPVDADKAVRDAVNSALGKLAALVAGESTGRATGFAVGKAQLTHYVKAFIAAGFVLDGAKLDKLALTAIPAPDVTTVEGIREKLAESLAATPAPVAAVVNG